MKVTIPAEQVDKEVDNRLKSLTHTVRLKGFRPGKVPLTVVAKRYGMHVRQEVLNELTQSSFREAIVQENLQLAGMPSIEPAADADEGNFEYTAVFEVFERFDLAPVKEIEITRPTTEIGEQDIDNMLEKLRRQRVEWRAVDRPALQGDQLVIDYRGTIDGAPFEGNESEKTPVVLGDAKFISGFEDQLIGVNTGDDVVVEVPFPEDYHAVDLAGKQARFEVHVHSVSEPILPDLDEEFARAFDIEDGTLESLRQEISNSMQEEMEQTVRDRVKRQVLDALLAANPIDLPAAQVEEQINLLIAQLRETAKSQNIASEEIGQDRELFRKQAEKQVALKMLTAEIVKQQQLVADPERVKNKVESVAAAYDSPDDVVKWYYGDRERLANIESLVLEDQVVDWVMDHARVTDEPTSFDELMKERQA